MYTYQETLKYYIDNKEQTGDFVAFSSSVIPNSSPIIGLRTPFIKQYCKEIAKNDPMVVFSYPFFQYYEIDFTIIAVICYSKINLQEKLNLLYPLLKNINCWSIVDSCCCILGSKKIDKELIYSFILKCIADSYEYTIRFGIVLFLNVFAKDSIKVHDFLPRLNNITYGIYYVDMAIAWLLSVTYLSEKEFTISFLLNSNNLNTFTYNKALQKMRESYRVDNSEKDYLKSLKK